MQQGTESRVWQDFITPQGVLGRGTTTTTKPRQTAATIGWTFTFTRGHPPTQPPTFSKHPKASHILPFDSLAYFQHHTLWRRAVHCCVFYTCRLIGIILNHIKLLSCYRLQNVWHNAPWNFLFWFSWLLLWFPAASFGSNWWAICWLHEVASQLESRVDGCEDNAGRVPYHPQSMDEPTNHSDPDSFNSTAPDHWSLLWQSGIRRVQKESWALQK